MAKGFLSKPWNWAQIPTADWMAVSDEFFPVAHRWKESSRRKVLDLGCGRGRHALFLAELGFSVTAIDLSPDGIRQLELEAERRGLSDRIEAVVSDMTSWSVADKAFDCVLGFHSIYHTTYEELKALIHRIALMLTDAGRIFITLNSKSNPSFRRASSEIVDEHTVIKMKGIEAGIPHAYVDNEDIRQLLSDYAIIKLQEITDYHEGGVSVHFFMEAEKR